MYKVAVLLATYNGEKYLKEQIESVLNQKDVEIELLVRDDCSDDETRNILKSYQDKGLLKFYGEKRMNVPYTFFDLIDNAPEADYYAFCDQDDVWDNDKLITAINALSEFKNDEMNLYCSGL